MVRSSRHKRGQGTFFSLDNVTRVVESHISEGRISIMTHHAARQVTVFIAAEPKSTEDASMLRHMAGYLASPARWRNELERDVGVAVAKGKGLTLSPAKRLRDVTAVTSQDAEGTADGPVGSEGQETAGETEPSAPRRMFQDSGGKVPNVLSTDVTLPPPKPDTLMAVEPRPSPARVKAGSISAEDTHQAATATAAASAGRTDEQRRALLAVQQGRSVFVTGPAGSGKTHWLMHLVRKHPSAASGTMAVTAASGTAARAIGGRTIHSFAGIGIHAETTAVADMVAHVMKHKSLVGVRDELRRTTLWIVDEVSMLSAKLLDVVDAVARAAKGQPDIPFGGIQMVFVGDFLQLPPVGMSSGGAGSDGGGGGGGGDSGGGGSGPQQLAFYSTAWRRLQPRVIEFTLNWRQSCDPEFFAALSDIRRGEVTDLVKTVLSRSLKRPLVLPAGVVATRIVARLKDAAAYNDAQLAQLQEDFHTFTAIDVGMSTWDVDHRDAFNAIMEKDTQLPTQLTLKPGAQVILTTALSSLLVNGALGVVIGFGRTAEGLPHPVVEFIDPASGTGATNVVNVLPVTLHPESSSGGGRGGGDKSRVSRTQLPLKLAWALTAHKCQGMTLPGVSISLDGTFFEYGQAYIALSRAQSSAALTLTALDYNVIRAQPEALAFYKPHWRAAAAAK